jgi:release factor glutamine methyltransferase
MGAISGLTRTVAEALRDGAARLRQPVTENPRLEARLLLAHAMGCSVVDLLRDPGACLPDCVYETLLARRAAHEPLAYILGRREFWSLDFAVSPATLIPRPDSETLVEAALAVCPPGPARVLDLGTGTGCLLLAVLHERPEAFGIGVDLSPTAASLAAANAASLGLTSRSAFLCGDWSAALAGRFDVVLSNPPYIATGAIGGLMSDVSDYEPALCLDGGVDGYDAYRRLVPDLPELLQPNGAAVLELGVGQVATVTALAAAAGLRADIRTDLGGIPRVIVLRRADR